MAAIESAASPAGARAIRPTHRDAGASILVAALVCGVGAAPARAAPDSDAGSGPPRPPSVSADAGLSDPGWLEVETAWQHERAGSERRDSVPVKLKLAFTPDLGVELGFDGAVRLRDAAGASRRGFGDTSLVVKRRFAVDDRQAFGLEAGVNLPTARRGLGSGSGQADFVVKGIYSVGWDDWNLDLNAAGTRLGAPPDGTGRSGLGWAVAAWRGWGDRWGVIGELSGSRQRGVRSERQVLLAVSRSIGPGLSLDVGAARSVRSGPPQASAFVGLTWLAARLF